MHKYSIYGIHMDFFSKQIVYLTKKIDSKLIKTIHKFLPSAVKSFGQKRWRLFLFMLQYFISAYFKTKCFVSKQWFEIKVA